mmetsp:Transcript_123107/g.344613  ORF Transcript_123107/g.344613 Transcript_123107/m.344613 type:complete len:285 (+) Transcript_123107:551-1405(+)
MAASRSSLITLIGWAGRPEALPWAARRTGAATAVVSPATMLLTSSRDSTTSPPMRCSIQEPTFTSGGSSATLAALTSSSWQMMDSRVLRPWACNLEMSSSRKRCSSGVSLSPGRVSRNSWARASRANFASSRAASSSSPPKVEGLKTLRSPMAPPFSARAEPLPPPLPFSPFSEARLTLSGASPGNTSLLFMPAAAAIASSIVESRTKPYPLHSPDGLSMTALMSVTVPNSEKSVLRLSSTTSRGRFRTTSLTPSRSGGFAASRRLLASRSRSARVFDRVTLRQ